MARGFQRLFLLVNLVFVALAQASPSEDRHSPRRPATPAITEEREDATTSARWRLPEVHVSGHVYKPYTFDGHVHTLHSPDAVEPTRDVLELALKSHLDAVIFTDHGMSLAAQDLRDYAGPVLYGMGQEVGGPWGHATIWNVDQRRGIADALTDLTSLGTRVHETGGLLVLAHPTWWMKRHEDAMHWMTIEALRRGGRSGEIDAFELWNSIYLGRQHVLVDAWLRAIEAGVFVPGVGASDFHRRSSHKVGRPRNVVLTEARTLAAMLDAVRKGRSYISDEAGIALTLDNTATFGDVVQTTKGRVHELFVSVTTPRFGGTLVLYQGRSEIARADLPHDTTWTQRYEVRIEGDSYVRAEILRPSPRPGRPSFMLITNPVLIEVPPLRTTFR